MPNELNYKRKIYCEDALSWLNSRNQLPGCSLVASLPDISEFPGHSLEQWKEWFLNTAELILSRTPVNGVTIFYQSDIKVGGVWVDKGYLCQKAGALLGHELLWHKIVCRSAPGQTTFGRPAYSHVLCFSREVRIDCKKSSPDVLISPGEKTWERGMGLDVCLFIAQFIIENTRTTTLVNPFCGQGAMLAAADALGLASVGIERSAKRAKMASNLKVDLQNRKFILP